MDYDSDLGLFVGDASVLDQMTSVEDVTVDVVGEIAGSGEENSFIIFAEGSGLGDGDGDIILDPSEDGDFV